VTTPRRSRSTPGSGCGKTAPRILTIGHSTRTIEDFIGLLQTHGVACVADVRTVPRSRHNPQFNAESLPASLKQAGIGYVHLAGLGGLRHTSGASLNTGWRNASFRGFADYMQTMAFENALEELVGMAKEEPVALMCAEALPWRCHRSLVADALLVRGFQVEHILSLGPRRVHTLTSFAKVRGRRLTYPQKRHPPGTGRSRASRALARGH
jgi:uncharacterized protein (DUF488 family)